MREAVFTCLWRGDIFARGLDLDGRLDTTAHASLLGLITPFPFLRLHEPADRQMATTMVDARCGAPAHRPEARKTLVRDQGDQYTGGGPSAVTTLWLARALLRLALTEPENERAREGVSGAAWRPPCVWCGAWYPDTGRPPEMIGPAPGEMWAVPHVWSTALLLWRPSCCFISCRRNRACPHAGCGLHRSSQ